MKKHILTIPLFAALLLTSCGRDLPKAYSEFIVNMPQFATSDGKTYWSPSNNFYWNEEGDHMYVNGVEFEIKKEGSLWRSYRTDGETSSVRNINDYFYLAYVGYAGEYKEINFESNGCRYSVSLDPIEGDPIRMVPLAARVQTNNVTLNPCCAVIHVWAGANGIMSISCENGGETFAMNGYINPATAMFEEVSEWFDEGYINIYEGENYIVLPMVNAQETINGITFSLDDTEVSTTAPSIVIKKGHFYSVNLIDM